MTTATNTFEREAKGYAIAKGAFQIILGSILISLSAPFSFPLYFSFVPIALQGHFALFISTVLGPKKGPAAVALFLTYALMGMPVLSSGNVGLMAFIGPAGGYVLGYFLASCMLSYFDASSRMKAFGMYLYGSGVFYLFGALWLSTYVGFEKAILTGVLPFIFGDVIKSALFAKLTFVRSRYFAS